MKRTVKQTLFILMIVLSMVMSACSSSVPDNQSELSNIDGLDSKYSILQPFDEGGLLIVRNNETGLIGGIDETGEFVLLCEYSSVQCEHDNLYILKKNDLYGLADGEGRLLMPCEFKSIELPDFDDWDEIFQDDLIIAEDSNGNFGYYSIKDGSEVIKPQFEAAESFWGGDRALVKSGELWGIIDRNGMMIVPAMYRIEDDPVVEWYGESLICIKDENGEKGLINTDGEIILPPGKMPENTDWNISGTSSDNLSVITIVTYSDTDEDTEAQYGVMDREGKYVIPLGDEPVLNEGHLFLVGEFHSGTPKIFNEKGDEILKDTYIIDEDCDISVTEPDTGLLIVRDRNTGKSGRLDSFGNEVIPCRYDQLDNVYYDEKTGNGLWMAWNNDEKRGLVNEKGEEVMAPGYDDISCFRDGYALVMNEGKVGCIDMDGKEVSPCQYSAYHIEDGYSFFRENSDIPENIIPVVEDDQDRIALMNSKGDLVTDFKYTYTGVTAGNKGYTRSCMVVKSGEEKYGIVDEKGKEVCPCDLYDVFGETGNGLFLVRKTDSETLSLIDRDGNTILKELDVIWTDSD